MLQWLNRASLWLFIAGSVFMQSTHDVRASDNVDGSVVDRRIQRGLFSEGFEMSAFEPCGSEERWWLQTAGPENETFWAEVKRFRDEYVLENNIKSDGNVSPVFYIEGKGSVSEPGLFGHMGWYQRQFILQDTSIIRVATVEDVNGC